MHTTRTLGICLVAGLLLHGSASAQCEGQGNATLVMKGICDSGAPLKFKLGGAPNKKFKLLTSIGSGPTTVEGIGTFCLDMSTPQTVAAQRFNGRGVAAIRTEVPNDPALVGEEIAFQFGVLDPQAPNGVAISNGYAFTICAAGSAGDSCIPCEEEGEPCSCGISRIGYIAPVFGDPEFPTQIEVRVADATTPEEPFGELIFPFDPENPPEFPVESEEGTIAVTKVTVHRNVVVVFAEANSDNLPEGLFPDVTLFETIVGEEKLNREIVTNCEEPLGPGFKFRPFFVTSVETVECEIVECPIALDFETEDDFATPLVNGQDISTPPEFGEFVVISSDGNNQGAAAFDSTSDGPNEGGPDPDLLVDLGNVLILQSNDSPEQTVEGIFDTPNDSAAGGTLVFDMVVPSEFFSIDLIDLCEGNQSATVTLIDTEGRERVYTVPAGWTNDINAEGPPGFLTLDLTTLDPQPGQHDTEATAAEDPDFDPMSVIRFEVFFESSAATDNIVFCPTL